MGLWAKWPVAMAPGMGLNAFFAFGVVLGMGQTWQVALGAVFIAGILFVILSLTGLREWIINSIPKSLKLGIGAGIGFSWRSSASAMPAWWSTARQPW